MYLKQVKRRVDLLLRRFLVLCIAPCLIFIVVLGGFSQVRRDERTGTEIRPDRLERREATTWNEFGPDNAYNDHTVNANMDTTGASELAKNANGGVEVKHKVVILMWTSYYHSGEGALKLNLNDMRRNPHCCDGVEVTQNRSQLAIATAVVFYHYFGDLNITDFPTTRGPDQLWVLFGKESPLFSPTLNEYNDLFNWTMNYRQDSDIWAPYGQSVELDESPLKIEVNGAPLDQWISGKTHLLTGVISHCTTPSKREDYIKKLREDGEIPVDIYGSCGTQICQRHISFCNHTAWWIKLASKYKFYFSAENSICFDYITEKFWRALELGMVPVAYGGGNYTKVAPPGSFIDTRDFNSLQVLAQYLKHLDNDPEEYKTYFDWRKSYTVRTTEAWHAWCDLCKEVQKYVKRLDGDTSEFSSMSRVYSELAGWWTHRPLPERDVAACQNPK